MLSLTLNVQDLIRVVKYHLPAGSSLRTLVHYGQNIGLDWNLSELSFILNERAHTNGFDSLQILI